jgi:hypothetical protein
MSKAHKLVKYIFLPFVLLVTLSYAYGQEIKLKAAIEKDSIWLGDQIRLILVAEQPANAKISFPRNQDTIAGKIEVLKRSYIDTAKLDASRLQLKQTYIITCFDSGAHYIPPFYFGIQKDGLNDSIKSNDLILFVKFPNVDLKKGIADIKKPFGAPVTFKEIAPWILGIILVGALLFLIVYMISRRRRNLPLFQRLEKPKLPAHIIALQELDKLKQEQLWQHNKVKDFYTRLTDIIRVYIEERFNVPAMEQTTFEILSEFREKKSLIETVSYDGLKDILELADFVKFAKLTPLPDENHLSLNNAYQFVERTKIEETTEPIKAEGGEKSNEEFVADLSEKEGKDLL